MKVWLVVSSYRNDPDIIRILEQERGCAEHPFDRILVADSEGTGAIPALLKQRRWDNVIYRNYDRNLGSGANLCERLRIAAEGGADFAYAINHDGYVDPGIAASLLRAAAPIEHLGAAYPLSYLTSVRRYNLTGTRELPFSAKLVAAPPAEPLTDVFWSSSNGALYSTAPVKHGILPWDALWMGWEDLEYGWRLSNHGYRQVIVRDAVYRDNYEYRSTKLGNVIDKPAWRTYYNMRNLILAIRRSRNRPLFYAVAAYRFLLECGVILLARGNKWERLRLLWTGAGDGFKGVEGQRNPLDLRA